MLARQTRSFAIPAPGRQAEPGFVPTPPLRAERGRRPPVRGASRVTSPIDSPSASSPAHRAVHRDRVRRASPERPPATTGNDTAMDRHSPPITGDDATTGGPVRCAGVDWSRSERTPAAAKAISGPRTSTPEPEPARPRPRRPGPGPRVAADHLALLDRPHPLRPCPAHGRGFEPTPADRRPRARTHGVLTRAGSFPTAASSSRPHVVSRLAEGHPEGPGLDTDEDGSTIPAPGTTHRDRHRVVKGSPQGCRRRSGRSRQPDPRPDWIWRPLLHAAPLALAAVICAGHSARRCSGAISGQVPSFAMQRCLQRALSTDPVVAARPRRGRRGPDGVWGRDESGIGEMRTSNSVIAWVLARSGSVPDRSRPPAGGAPPAGRLASCGGKAVKVRQ